MRQRRAVAIVGVRFEHCVDNFQDTTIGKARLWMVRVQKNRPSRPDD